MSGNFYTISFFGLRIENENLPFGPVFFFFGFFPAFIDGVDLLLIFGGAGFKEPAPKTKDIPSASRPPPLYFLLFSFDNHSSAQTGKM